jgi:hypothetical protein
MRDVNSVVFGQAGPVRQAYVGLSRNADQFVQARRAPGLSWKNVHCASEANM